MSGPHPAVAATRLAVRADLEALPTGSLALVGCSGGPDSLALAAAVAFEAPRLAVRAGAVVVDHRLQEGSGAVAERAARHCRDLGLDPVATLTVDVSPRGDGRESAARRARYAALDDAAKRLGAGCVLLGHTRDDQAEQVLLGLARGSGARSLAGMPRARGRYVRPFLALGRADTEAACTAYGLEPWQDAHNDDPTFRRVRARRLLRAMEDELGPGIAPALARTAELLREDADHLEALAEEAWRGLGLGRDVDATALLRLPRAIRTRVWRRLALEAGSPGGSLSAGHVDAADALLTGWHGQGPVSLPGHVLVTRHGGRIVVERGAPG